MKCKSCKLEYPSEEYFKKKNLCMVCYRKKVFFWIGITAGSILVVISAKDILGFQAGLLLAPIIAGASGRGALKGLGNAFLALMIGAIAMMIIIAISEGVLFDKEMYDSVIATTIMGSIGIGIMFSFLGIIPGWIHKLVTKNKPVYKLYDELKSARYTQPTNLTEEELNKERPQWNDKTKAQIIEALESDDSSDLEWARNELNFYIQKGIAEASEIVTKYKLDL